MYALSKVPIISQFARPAHNAAAKGAQQTLRLSKSSNCFKSQALGFTTTFSRCDERDNNKVTAHEGHHNASNIYQSLQSRLVFSTPDAAAAATDRLVYQRFGRTLNLENRFINQQPHTRHSTRFYCTKSTKRKMVSN